MKFMKLFYSGIILLMTFFIASCGGEPEGAVSSNAPELPVATVGLLNNDIEIQPGSIMEVDIVMSDFPVSEGGGVTIKYDPSLMHVRKIEINEDIWGFVNKLGHIDNKNGVVSNILVSSYKGVSGSEVIATIEIEARSEGVGQIYLEGSEDNPFSSSGKRVAVNFVKSEINVRAIN